MRPVGGLAAVAMAVGVVVFVIGRGLGDVTNGAYGSRVRRAASPLQERYPSGAGGGLEELDRAAGDPGLHGATIAVRHALIELHPIDNLHPAEETVLRGQHPACFLVGFPPAAHPHPPHRPIHALACTRKLFPRWTPVAGGVIGPEERLPWGQTLVVGLQHVFAMFGATVLVPILMGFDPNTSVFFSGIRISWPPTLGAR
jgi:hypothetical protein